MYLNQLSVRSRLILLVALPCIAFLLLAAVTLILTGNLVAGIQSINNDRVVPLKQIKVVSDNYAVSIVDNLHKYNAGLMSKSELLDSISDAESLASSQWSAYLQTELTPEESRLIRNSEALFDNVKAQVEKYKSLLRSDKALSASSQQFVKELYDTFDPFSSSLNALIDLQLNTSQQFSDQAAADYQKEKMILVTVCIILFIIVIFLAVAINRSITLPLNNINQVMASIANNTDLTMRVNENGDDEFAQTASSVNTMLSHFNALITELLSLVINLRSQTEGLSENSLSIANSTEQQEQQTTMLATAITQMSAAIKGVADTAVTTSQKANESDALAQAGLHSVQDNIQAINQLHELLNQTKSDIDLLSGKTNEINSVVQIIQSVAEQTNLLALNAAIEAARAGESGRGFAVVADEVRQLAHNTQKATEQISEMIVSLQDASKRTVDSMEQAANQTEKSVSIAAGSAESIQKITSAISEIADLNIVISTSTEEQTTVANEVAENINQITTSIKSVANSASENAQTSQNLKNISNELEKDISKFKV
ncbi:methyl-accepting chemotaxis protein [Pseudoalteromonas phenolica]|uniref:Methyl-accepting chemotaxis protein n=1 Tax=Pseudoalteromonas phenolica TaxID=161398 RepID=A0A0S2K7H2_9GAMM|nr:HAMP domain-containing methyl-accepting chemotaxis protein [Pseudoalteromonas phenolica]ALO44225.1 Methyl-accepting chemotaxis protein [Pseudoalteromonas phenolica]MBE0357217.1 methyl-accepting chemotaxis protein [Pseudoalteromonas phenolica O-BC30]RXF03589.1 methyl-accepting chemotaxis protein [Pseudoalteromonas phenolica O-BC30]